MNSTERYRYRQSIGLCPICGKARPAEGASMCDRCREAKKTEARLRRAQAKQLGICPACFKTKLYVGEKVCPECYEKAKKYRDDHRQERADNQRKHRYDRPKDDTKCIHCRKRPPQKGYKSCAYCRARLRNKHRKIDLAPVERPSYGLCYFCGEPVIDGKKVCQRHYELSVANLRRASTKDHWWRKDEHIRYEHIKKGKIS